MKIDRDPKVSESPRKIDPIHQNDSIVATRACAVATKMQTAEINMAIKRMLENKIHLLDVSYVSTYILRSDHLE